MSSDLVADRRWSADASRQRCLARSLFVLSCVIGDVVTASRIAKQMSPTRGVHALRKIRTHSIQCAAPDVGPATFGQEVAMRKSFGLVSLLVMALVLVAGAGITQWQQARAQETFTVIEHATTDTVTDLGDEGDSIGDTLTFSNEIYDDQDVNVVGTSSGTCWRTEPGKSWECTWTNALEDGSIVVQGPFHDSGDSTLAITGGTGKYSGASGEMKLHARDGGTEFEFTFIIN
jgi:allene oxide cyclase